MSSQKKRTLKTRRTGGAGTLLLCLVGAAGAARAQNAQNVLGAPPPILTTPPAVQEQLSQGTRTIPMEITQPPSDLPEALRWGSVEVHPHALYRILYGNGIQSSPGLQQKTLIEQFSPGLLLHLGSHWIVDYTPTFSYYSNRSFHDTLDHVASLTWGSSYEDWTFGFSQRYANTDEPLAETGTQTATQSYTTSINASRRINSVMSVDMAVDQSIRDAVQLNSSRSWSTLDWLNYQFWPRLTGAVGAGFGYDAVSVGPNMTHETLQARLNWRAGDKLSLAVHGGAEDRQYLGSGVPNTINPTYGASIQYQPVETTSLALNADRATSASLFQGFATDTSTLGISLTQRLLKHLSLNLSGSYGAQNYLITTPSSSTSVNTGRSDTYYSFSARLSCQFLKRATAALTEQYSVNRSNKPGFGYASNQIGIELGYAF